MPDDSDRETKPFKFVTAGADQFHVFPEEDDAAGPDLLHDRFRRTVSTPEPDQARTFNSIQSNPPKVNASENHSAGRMYIHTAQASQFPPIADGTNELGGELS
jgi:hypothetical protein